MPTTRRWSCLDGADDRLSRAWFGRAHRSPPRYRGKCRGRSVPPRWRWAMPGVRSAVGLKSVFSRWSPHRPWRLFTGASQAVWKTRREMAPRMVVLRDYFPHDDLCSGKAISAAGVPKVELYNHEDFGHAKRSPLNFLPSPRLRGRGVGGEGVLWVDTFHPLTPDPSPPKRGRGEKIQRGHYTVPFSAPG